jgi:predicted dehydrogenase
VNPRKLERLLVVGMGSIGKRHARVARELVAGVSIAALRHSGCQDWQTLGVDHCFTSMEDALRFQPQAAVIANPATMHLEAAMPLARAGVHLLIEKPMAGSVAGIRELIDVCAARSATLMVGYNMRFLPPLARFRELLAQNAVGRVLSVRAEVGQYLPSWRPGTDYRQNVSAQAALGGGVILELSHEIDYLRWLFGEVEWVSSVSLRQSDLEIDVEDTAHAVLGFAPDANGRQLVASLTLDFIRQDTCRSCTAIGDAGSLRWNALAGAVERFEMGGTEWQPVFVHASQRDESYIGEWRHFITCLQAGTAPDVSGADGLAALQVIEAMRTSAATAARATVQRGFQ